MVTLGEPPPDRRIVFQVRGVSKHFGGIAALTDVSFDVRAGEVLGLIGPNGAGKTTLFECLAGVLPVDRGGVMIDSVAIHADRRKSVLFYMPDTIAPWPAQQVRWVLEFVVGFFGGPADRRATIIEQLGLTPLLDQSIGTLSKGQRKRVLLAAALLAPAPVLLIDEPFDGLDLRQARDVAAALRTHAQQGRTLFLSIHQIIDAARFCDRFVLLSAGRMCGEGTVDELSTLATRRASGSYHDLEEVFLALT